MRERISPSLSEVSQSLTTGLLVVGVMAMAEWVGLVQPVRRQLEWLSRPLGQLSTALVQVGLTPLNWSWRVTQQARRIQDLEFRYAEALAQVSELDSLKAENEALRKIVENADRRLEVRIIAAPLVALAEPAVAGGSADGVQPGQVVIVAGVVVGRITSVSEHQAQVRLLSATESEGILARTESGVEGIITGDGKRILLTEIPLDVQIQPNERVVTVGQPGVPPNLLLGRVQTVRGNESAPVRTATIDQIVSFYQARLVEIR